MSNIHQPNDKFFKAAFKYPAVVREFLRHFMPKKLVDSLDFKTLALDSTNYIREELSEYFSDVVYNCTINGKTTTIILLFEHKISISHDIYIQLILYITEILKQNYKTHKRYDVVIPIVIYQGTDKFVKRPFHTYFENVEPQFQEYIPHFNFELVQIQKIEDKDILSFSDDSPLKGILLTMKHNQRKSFIKKYFGEILRFSADKPLWADLFKQTIVYLYEKSGLSFAELKALIEAQNNENMKVKGMSAAQELRTEGKLQAKTEGIIKALKLSKFTIEEIAEVFDVTVMYVLQIKKENKL